MTIVSLNEVGATYRRELDRLKTTAQMVESSKTTKRVSELQQISHEEQMDIQEEPTQLQIEVNDENITLSLPDSAVAGGSKITVKVETPTKRSSEVSDDTKLKLLADVLNDCPDPSLSNRGKKGIVTALTEQYEYIREKEVEHDGEMVPWKYVVKNATFVEFFYRRGFRAQWKKEGIVPNKTGLLSVIRDFVGDSPEVDCKCVKEELLAMAKKLSDKYEC